jgi:two-component system, OmpR family, heavy metal sensor histidine kinase CusS
MFKKFLSFILSTRIRLTIWYALVFLLLEILLGTIIYYYLYTTSQEKLDQALSTQANAIMRIVKAKHVDLDLFEPDENYESNEDLIWDIIYDVVMFNERNTFIQITSGRRILYKSDNLGSTTLKFPMKSDSTKGFSFTNKKISKEGIRAVQIIDRKYKVIVAYPEEHIRQTLKSLTDIYVLITPIFFIISLIGGALISQRSLSRIDAIIKKTEEITAQNLSEIIPGSEFTDEYGRLVRKMNEMIARIKSSVEYMNQFSISAAHELKTPLTILRGEIEVALKSEKTPKQYIEILKSNYEETLRLIKIIENLFFISKSENDLIKISPQQTAIKEFLSGMMKNFNILAEERGVKIEFSAPENLIVDVDNQLLKQTMLNLIDNAIKYGSENKPVTIGVCEGNNNTWEMKISNFVDEKLPQDIDKIFNRFYRVESSRSRTSGGVGLGLAVVKSIVSLHGGKIIAENSNDVFSIVISLPVSVGENNS